MRLPVSAQAAASRPEFAVAGWRRAESGVAGRFDFHLKFSPGELTSAAADSTAPSIFTAVQDQLGLRLEPARGSVPVLVIDGLERPSGN